MPDVLLEVFNSDIALWECLCIRGSNAASVRGYAYSQLHRWILKVEEKPVVTRFWLFTECVFCFARMQILQIPVDTFNLQAASENQKRIAAFQKWYAEHGSDKYVRKSALCLRLAQFACNLSSKKNTGNGQPTLVRLALGEVQRRTSELLQEMLPLLDADPVLDVNSTFLGLLVTEAHIIIRYSQYRRYPNRICLMCAVYNPLGYPDEIETFLQTPDLDLDFGYGLPLKRDALAKGKAAKDYLTTTAMQQELEGIFHNASSHTLDGEREHNLVKKSERRKLVSVGTASRDNLIRDYRANRSDVLKSMAEEEKATKKKRHSNVWSLARQDRPDLVPRPRGRRVQEEGISEAQMKEIVYPEDRQALDEYVEQNREDLEARKDADHAAARAACR